MTEKRNPSQTANRRSQCAGQRRRNGMRWCVGGVACVWLLWSAGLSSAATIELGEQLRPMIKSHRGQAAVAVKHLETGESFEYRADEPMPTASLIKFPLMVAAYAAIDRGELDASKKLTLKEDDQVPGSGILTGHFSAGTQLSLRDAIQLMIAYSDNTATNLVIDQTGLPATAELMETLDCPHTKLHSKVFRRNTSIFPERSKEFGLGSTTAAEMVRLLEKLHARQLVSEEASETMLEHLFACQNEKKLLRNLPQETKVAHKGGAVSAVRTEAGIIISQAGPIAVCVLTADNEDRSWGNDNEAEILCGQIALVAYQYFNPSGEPLQPTIARVLKLGASGSLIESLQRTLNARLDPSPELAVDGDFGPMTEAAVLRFQEENQLPADGAVGPDLWRALGTLITEDEPVPEPEAVNQQPVKKSPPDPLSGPPFVTCKAWAISDARTGKLLWGYNDSRPRHPASTTKIMTAYVVTRLAERDPSVLEEIVTFSRRADETPGSTSGIRQNEQIAVNDLMYGLMLPSGNDASVALAEHFGPRLSAHKTGGNDGENGNGEIEPYAAFVDAMNRAAEELGLEETRFVNTHGLTSAKHKTSARDLAELGRSALASPMFRRYVSTSRYGCRVQSTAGYERNVVWRNTNRLLATEGYEGIKTGTTGAAGACLVSYGRRNDDELILVVLGASSSAARYTDSRNLYRWAWQQLGHEQNDE